MSFARQTMPPIDAKYGSTLRNARIYQKNFTKQRKQWTFMKNTGQTTGNHIFAFFSEFSNKNVVKTKRNEHVYCHPASKRQENSHQGCSLLLSRIQCYCVLLETSRIPTTRRSRDCSNLFRIRRTRTIGWYAWIVFEFSQFGQG